VGYKNTEIGIIPVDWKVVTFGNVFNIVGGGAFKSSDSQKNGIKWLKIANVGINKIKWDDESYLPAYLLKEFINFELKEGDYVLALTRPILSNKLKISKLNKTDVPALLNQRVGKITTNKNNDIDFIYFLLQNNRSINALLQSMAGTDPPNLGNKGVYRIVSAVPKSLPEQTAIAKVLSDTDNLLQALQKKIAKKRLIKKGAMQVLLKPKEGWVQETLPKVCWYQEGPGLRNWQFTKKGMKVINVTNLVNGYLNLDKTDRHISMQEFEKMYKHFEIDDKDIVMASSGNSYSKVAVVRKQDLRLLMNTSVIRFKPMYGLDYNYLLIFLKSNLFKDQIDLLITGGAQPNFGPAHLKKIKIPLPPTKQEQTRIATILSDMDAEIESLEKKLAKYKQVKQGLMQVLLTGKIRLYH